MNAPTTAEPATAEPDIRLETDADIGERMILNMGPSHPSTHGVLRIVLELDGERVVSAVPDIGYLHRGMEKLCETLGYHRFIPYTDRLDYLSPLHNNCALTHAAEKVYEIIEELIKLAEFEERVERIADELGTTSRKVNALENMVLPDMRYIIKFIEDKLDEESMEELVRMKLIGGAKKS